MASTDKSCWSCQKEAGEGHFCRSCQKIQPLSGEDYFIFLGIPRKMNVEIQALEKTFYELSRKLHPDFFQGKSFKEKVLSVERTTVLNRAYNTLKDPVARAEYLLHLEVPTSGKERTRIEPVLVSEIFEIQERVEEEKRTNDPRLKAELEASKKEVEGKIEIRRNSLQTYFDAWDGLGKDLSKKEELARTLRKTIDEITYLNNLVQSIETGGAIRH